MSRTLRAVLLTTVLAAQGLAGFAYASHGTDSIIPGAAPDLRVLDAYVRGDPIQKWFVGAGSTVSMWLNVTNDGTAAFDGPLYVDIRQVGAASTIPGGCPQFPISVPAGSTTPTRVDMTWTVPTAIVPTDAWQVRIFVNAQDSPAGCAPAGGHKHEVAAPPGPGGATTQTGALDDNSVVLTFAVNRKPDLRLALGANAIQWCRGATHTGLCTPVGTQPGDYANTTRYDPDAKTYFAFQIKNGEQLPDGTYPSGVYRAGQPNLILPGNVRVAGLCEPVGGGTDNLCKVPVRVRATEVASPDQITNLDATVTDWAGLSASCGPLGSDNSCTNFNLNERAGNFTVTVELDPSGRFPNADTGQAENRSASRRAEVRGAELMASYDIVGEPQLPTDGTQKPLWFNVTIKNVGYIPASGNGDIQWTTYLLNPKENEPRRVIGGGTIPVPFAPGATAKQEIKYFYSSDKAQGTFIRGGRVEILTVIDRASDTDLTNGRYVEQCERDLVDTVGCAGLNNGPKAAVRIFDAERPRVESWGFSTGDAPPYTIDVSDPAPAVTKKEPVQFTVVIADNDEALHTATEIVRINFTVNGQTTSHWFGPGVKHNNLFYFTKRFDTGLAAVGAYSVKIDVKDSFGNRPETAPAARAFEVRPWAIQTKAESAIWLEKPTLLGPQEQQYTWHVKVGSAETGVADATRDPSGSAPVLKKWITITKPDGTSLYTNPERRLLTSNARCSVGGIGGSCTRWDFTDEYVHTSAAINILGTWKSVIEIEDKAGDVRKLWHNFTIRDAIPTISLLDFKTSVDAKTPYDLHLDITDDAVAVGAVHANWTHTAADGTVTKRNMTVPRVGSCETTGSNVKCTHRLPAISTGFGGELPFGGDWTLRIEIREGGGAHLWYQDPPANQPARKVTVADKRDPDISLASASAREEEAGFPVTWNLTAADDTAFTGYLTIVKADGTFVEGFNLKPMSSPDEHGEMWLRAPLPLGEYKWRMTVKDSVGKTRTTAEHPLSVLANTKPRFSVVTPGPSLAFTTSTGDSAYHGKVRPEITVLAYDNDGVRRESLKVFTQRADENTWTDVTTSVWIRPSVNPEGWFVTYNHTRNEGNNTRVALRVVAEDKSEPAQEATGEVTVIVDGQAPTTALLDDDISQPRYRASTTHAWNITGATRLKLKAGDPGGSGVDEVQYSLTGANGPWTKADAAGFHVTALPGEHTLWFRAVDRVGNQGAAESRKIFLDTFAPTFGKLAPHYDVDEKWTNFTILDTGTGVQRATTYYRVNNGEWRDLPLSYHAASNRWVGALPNLTKGARLSIYVTAADFVHNEGAWGSANSPAANFTVGNRRPVVSILEPADNVTVSGPVTIAWDISDPDGDNLKISLFYRPEAEPAWRLVGENFTQKKGKYDLDTTTLLDGRYVFEVSAYDGSFYATQSVTLTIRNSLPPINNIKRSADAPEIGQPVTLSAVVTKKDVVWVAANISVNGKRVATLVPLNDQGKNGDLIAGDHIYATAYTPTAPGKYDIDIVVKYREGGAVHDYRRQTTFSVQATTLWVVQEHPMLWAAIAVFGLAVVGAGAWGISRRWS